MTNNELSNIIAVVKKHHINVENLRRLLLALETSRIEVEDDLMLCQPGLMNDEDVLCILEKVTTIGCHKWECIIYLEKVPKIKEFLKNEYFKKANKDTWELVLEIIYKLSLLNKSDVEELYCTSLLKQMNISSNQELEFFQRVFCASISSQLLFRDWYLDYLLDTRKTRKMRSEVLKLMKAIIIREEELDLDELEALARKAIKCYELYGRDLAFSYVEFAWMDPSLPVPHIEDEREKEIYEKLYLFDINKHNAKNFHHSFYYSIVTAGNIDVEKRLEFLTNLEEMNLIFKDSIVEKLWNIYLKLGIEGMLILKFAFLNNGIRNNVLCREFLGQADSLEVLKLAREVFFINLVRKDKESLSKLAGIQSEIEKEAYLQHLKDKYLDEISEQIKRREAAAAETIDTYNAFLDKNVGLDTLVDSLEKTTDLHIELKRKIKC